MAKKARNKGVELSQKMRQLSTTEGDNTLGEVAIYNPDDSIRLEVRLENETVWLNRSQMALLFDWDVKTIGKHSQEPLQEHVRNARGAGRKPVASIMVPQEV